MAVSFTFFSAYAPVSIFTTVDERPMCLYLSAAFMAFQKSCTIQAVILLFVELKTFATFSANY